MAAIISTPRGRHEPDHRSGAHAVVPQPVRHPVRPRLQLRVGQPHLARDERALLGVRAARSSNSPTTDAPWGTGAAVSFQVSTTRARSASPSTAMPTRASPSRDSGSVTSAASARSQQPLSRATVSASNRSAGATVGPALPAGAPPGRTAGHLHLDRTSPPARSPAFRRPPHRRGPASAWALLWRVSITWKSGSGTSSGSGPASRPASRTARPGGRTPRGRLAYRPSTRGSRVARQVRP